MLKRALALSAEERAELADSLLESLDGDDDDPEAVSAAWDEEIARRIEDFDSGRVEPVSLRGVSPEAFFRCRISETPLFIIHPGAVAEAEKATRWYRARSAGAAAQLVEEINLAPDPRLARATALTCRSVRYPQNPVAPISFCGDLP